MSDFDFNVNEAKSDQFELLPPGKYVLIVDETEVKSTKDNTGKYIKLKLRVIEGHGENRILFHNLNFQNKSEKAQNIGRAQMKSLAIACGLKPENVRNATDYIGYKLMAAVKIKKDEEYGDQNRITGFYPLQSPHEMLDSSEKDLPF